MKTTKTSILDILTFKVILDTDYLHLVSWGMKYVCHSLHRCRQLHGNPVFSSLFLSILSSLYDFGTLTKIALKPLNKYIKKD